MSVGDWLGRALRELLLRAGGGGPLSELFPFRRVFVAWQLFVLPLRAHAGLL